MAYGVVCFRISVRRREFGSALDHVRLILLTMELMAGVNTFPLN